MAAGGAAAVSNQNASSFSSVDSENDYIATLASGTDSVDFLVDYSDFANFVTFNSAESYVTITADQILNDYPLAGTVNDVQVFLDSLDGYQRYFLQNWPHRAGHLRFSAATVSASVRFDDIGISDGVVRSSFISPGTGSLSIQGWIDVPEVNSFDGPSRARVVFQKLASNGNGLSVFVSSSLLYFQVTSGSTTTTLGTALTEMPMFFAGVIDRTSATGSVKLYAATSGSFPVLSDSASVVFGSRFDLASGSFYMGSGSLTAKNVVDFSGSIDNIAVWSTPRSISQLSQSFNQKVYAQPGLVACWRFNDCTPDATAASAAVVRDASGHRLDGRISNYSQDIRGSGSLITAVADPILTIDDPNVFSYIVDAQASGVLYDRDNQSLIFNLFPGAFNQGDPASTEVFRNFALIMARSFDKIKIAIDQLPNLRRVNYGEHDQAPDELLGEVGRFFGWDPQGSFATADAQRYLGGQNIHVGPAGNISTEQVLSDIKSAFWRRMVQNLLYIYKTKGTRESVEALLRIYGANNGFVRLKEYARKSEGRLPLERVVTEKSTYAMRFVSGAAVSFMRGEASDAVDSTLVALWGQSNATTTGLVSALTDSEWADAYPAVQMVSRQAPDFSDPPNWTLADGDLEAITFEAAPRVGLMNSMMRDLDRAAPGKFYLHHMAIYGTSLATHWGVSASFPAAKNLHNVQLDEIEETMAAFNCTRLHIAINQGEGDSLASGSAALWETRATQILTSIRSRFGSDVKATVGLVNSSVNTGSYPHALSVRANQVAFAANVTDVESVSLDTLTLADGVHYDANNYIEMGHLYAGKIAEQLGLEIPPEVSFVSEGVGLDVTFTPTTLAVQSPIVTHHWDFGDGNTSTDEEPEHTYATAGTYDVVYTGTDALGNSDSIEAEVIVNGLAVTSDATSGKYLPQDLTEWNALLTGIGSTMSAPDAMWRCQEPSGSLFPSIGEILLAPSANAPSYRQAVAGWSTLAVTFPDGSIRQFFSTTGSLPNLATDDMFTIAYVAFPASAPSVGRNVMQMGTGNNTNADMVVLATSGKTRTASGANTNTSTSTTTCDGAVHFVGLLNDRTNSRARGYTDLDKMTPTFSTSVTGRQLAIGFSNAGFSLAEGVLYIASWFNANARVSDADVKLLAEGLGFTIPWS